MEPSAVWESVLPADWTEVLHTVDQALEQAVAAAWQRERELPEPPARILETDQTAAWQQALQRLEEHIQGLQTVARQAEGCVAEADAVLQAEEAALRRWLAALEPNR